MRRRISSGRLSRINRLVFFYFFRDYSNDTLDAGIEFTTLSPIDRRRLLCRALTFNIKGAKRDSFTVDRATRKIRGLSGRYVCYWIDPRRDSVKVYDRTYRRLRGGNYFHASRRVESELAFDDDGFEKKAENLVSAPRSYYEVFVRLFRF